MAETAALSVVPSERERQNADFQRRLAEKRAQREVKKREKTPEEEGEDDEEDEGSGEEESGEESGEESDGKSESEGEDDDAAESDGSDDGEEEEEDEEEEGDSGESDDEKPNAAKAATPPPAVTKTAKEESEEEDDDDESEEEGDEKEAARGEAPKAAADSDDGDSEVEEEEDKGRAAPVRHSPPVRNSPPLPAVAAAMRRSPTMRHSPTVRHSPVRHTPVRNSPPAHPAAAAKDSDDDASEDDGDDEEMYKVSALPVDDSPRRQQSVHQPQSPAAQRASSQHHGSHDGHHARFSVAVMEDGKKTPLHDGPRHSIARPPTPFHVQQQRHHAAVKIQSFYRGYAARKSYKEQKAAATKVQRAFRGHNQRRKSQAALDAAIAGVNSGAGDESDAPEEDADVVLEPTAESDAVTGRVIQTMSLIAEYAPGSLSEIQLERTASMRRSFVERSVSRENGRTSSQAIATPQPTRVDHLNSTAPVGAAHVDDGPQPSNATFPGGRQEKKQHLSIKPLIPRTFLGPRRTLPRGEVARKPTNYLEMYLSRAPKHSLPVPNVLRPGSSETIAEWDIKPTRFSAPVPAHAIIRMHHAPNRPPHDGGDMQGMQTLPAQPPGPFDGAPRQFLDESLDHTGDGDDDFMLHEPAPLEPPPPPAPVVEASPKRSVNAPAGRGAPARPPAKAQQAAAPKAAPNPPKPPQGNARPPQPANRTVTHAAEGDRAAAAHGPARGHPPGPQGGQGRPHANSIAQPPPHGRGAQPHPPADPKGSRPNPGGPSHGRGAGPAPVASKGGAAGKQPLAGKSNAPAGRGTMVAQGVAAKPGARGQAGQSRDHHAQHAPAPEYDEEWEPDPERAPYQRRATGAHPAAPSKSMAPGKSMAQPAKSLVNPSKSMVQPKPGAAGARNAKAPPNKKGSNRPNLSSSESDNMEGGNTIQIGGRTRRTLRFINANPSNKATAERAANKRPIPPPRRQQQTKKHGVAAIPKPKPKTIPQIAADAAVDESYYGYDASIEDSSFNTSGGFHKPQNQQHRRAPAQQRR